MIKLKEEALQTLTQRGYIDNGDGTFIKETDSGIICIDVNTMAIGTTPFEGSASVDELDEVAQLVSEGLAYLEKEDVQESEDVKETTEMAANNVSETEDSNSEE